MLYEFHQGHNAAESSRNICSTYGNVVNERTCRKWFVRFKERDFSLVDRPRSGHPSVVDEEALKKHVNDDPTKTTSVLATVAAVPGVETCHQSTIARHLHRIGKTNREGAWVPHMLSEKNMADRVSVCRSLLVKLKEEQYRD